MKWEIATVCFVWIIGPSGARKKAPHGTMSILEAWVPQLMIELKFKELIRRDGEAEQRLKMVLKSRESSARTRRRASRAIAQCYQHPATSEQRALWPWTKKECAEVDAEIHAWKKWLSLSTRRVDFRSDKMQKLSKSLQVGREEQLNWIELTALLSFCVKIHTGNSDEEQDEGDGEFCQRNFPISSTRIDRSSEVDYLTAQHRCVPFCFKNRVTFHCFMFDSLTRYVPWPRRRRRILLLFFRWGFQFVSWLPGMCVLSRSVNLHFLSFAS